MLSTQTSYCDEYNINRNDCDYNSVGLKHFCFTIGYLFGKRFLNIQIILINFINSQINK